MAELYYDINIPEWQAWPFKEGVDLGIEQDIGQILYFKDQRVLRDDLVSSYLKHGLRLREVHYFIIPPEPYMMTVHVDGQTDAGDAAAINWVACDSKWTMNWYSPNAEPIHNGLARVGENKYVGYDVNDCTLIEQHFWNDRPCLVKTDVPHNVTIYGDSYRYCASLRFVNANFDTIKSKILRGIIE